MKRYEFIEQLNKYLKGISTAERNDVISYYNEMFDDANLDEYVEVTLKDDERNDPLITSDALEMLGIMTKAEYEKLKEMTIEIGRIVKDELAKRDMELYDIKFEFGRVGSDNHIALIDEISGGNMRAYYKGEYIEPLELEKKFFE